ncbi:DUF5107 domain-containing protein [Paenibacillus koleovorans]|uniref:DUF5107 domain-containing protein n=1 Tax=Paenibacillus koleovorans TaxID=121608 RepID=UPI000FDB0607|nr:DUF5107 domain-containing protein [Paenibacillus koleovorans]
MPGTATKAYEERLTIPTYPMEAADRNPAIGSFRFEKPYPYPMFDSLSDERVLEEYRGLVLENEYLKVTVLPKLGAKLYSALDKRNGEQVFYLNRVVKPQLVGLTGAWTSGGIEFNFPRAHRPSCMLELEAVCRENGDGTASIVLGETDRSSGLVYSVELLLHPEKAYIEQIMRVHNPTAVPQRFFVWNTSSYPETRNMELRYPIKWYIEEFERKRYPWPYEGSVDLRRADQYRRLTGWFGSRVEDDFFGVYDDELGRGTVHVADHMEAPGKKIWIWGNADLGKLWNELLTEEDGPYVEYQSGNVQTQNAFTWLAPYQRHTWKEYWFQAINTGPFTYACKEAIVTAKVEETATAGELKLALQVHPNELFHGAKLLLLNDAHSLPIFEANGDWAPNKPGQWDIPLPAEAFTESVLRLRLYDKDGELAIDYIIRNNEAAAEQMNGLPEIQQDDDTKTLLYRLSQAECRMRYEEAYGLVNELLAANPTYLEAYLRKAVLQVKMLDLASAKQTIMQVLALNVQSQEAQYYAGLIMFLMGDRREAKPYLLEVNDTSSVAPQACILLGKMALLDRDYAKAKQYFEKAANDFGRSETTEILYAYALWKQGSPKKAQTVLERYLGEYPLDWIARAQQWLQSPVSERQTIGWFSIHDLLHAVQFYAEIGDLGAQSALLEAYVQTTATEPANPLVLYHLGRLHALQGRFDQAEQQYRQAESSSIDYVFPTLGLTLDAVQDAIARLGAEAVHARYLAGLIYYSVERMPEAIAMWSECVKAGMSSSVVYRNLGLTLIAVGRSDEAIGCLEQGLGFQPFNPDIVLFLNRLYRDRGWIDKRLKLIEAIPDPSRVDEKLARVLITVYNDTGDYDKAVELLETRSFRAWEIEENPDMNLKLLQHQTWLGKADIAMKARQWDEAIRCLEKATSYGSNTQLARSWEQCDIRFWLLLAICHEKLGKLGLALHYCNRIAACPQQRHSPDYADYIRGTQKKVELEWLGVNETIPTLGSEPAEKVAVV